MAKESIKSASISADKTSPEKERALSAALAQIERQFGKGSMMRLGDKELVKIPSISTGSLGLDVALGIGGLPQGRVVEIYGPESSGKTTLTLQVIAEAQKAGGTCAFIEAEHALDPLYAHALGVNTDDMLVSQPDTGEQALEICDMLVRSAASPSFLTFFLASVLSLLPRWVPRVCSASYASATTPRVCGYGVPVDVASSTPICKQLADHSRSAPDALEEWIHGQ